ncbi:MAG TPA: (2Fe-2S)-binding protein [Candidatus Polarisedimenticolia bacterium]|nr:(2Fe-2S)-binding protein [Candidatus Polarisedimenticolia bacterium]
MKDDTKRGPRAAARMTARTAARSTGAATPPPGKVLVRFVVNGEAMEAAIKPQRTLLEVLREDLALTGTKHGCELGECGTCTVLLDGKPVLSCLVLGLECAGRPIVTVEGLAKGPEPDPLQTAFAELGAAQCGYCTPGILCAARALLDQNARPSRDQIKEALSGNLCRCTGYIKIFEAVELAAERQQNPAAAPAEEVLRGRS